MPEVVGLKEPLSPADLFGVLKQIGYASLLDVVRVSRMRFVWRHERQLEWRAGEIYDAARSIAAQLAYNEPVVLDESGAPLLKGVRALKDGPGYQDLFPNDDWEAFSRPGTREAFDSPVAYLADLYRLALAIEKDAGSQAIRLSDRRPDLANLVLDEKNTFQEVPALTLAQEILEDGAQRYLANNGGMKVDEALAVRRHPFIFPFSRPARQVHEGLGEKKTDLGAVITLADPSGQAMGPGDSTLRAACIADTNLSPEQIALLLDQREAGSRDIDTDSNEEGVDRDQRGPAAPRWEPETEAYYVATYGVPLKVLLPDPNKGLTSLPLFQRQTGLDGEGIDRLFCRSKFQPRVSSLCPDMDRHFMVGYDEAPARESKQREDQSSSTKVSLKVGPSWIPDSQVGKTYSTTFSGTGGTAPYRFRVSAGTLPPGLKLNEKSGTLSGVLRSAGTYRFTILATDQNGNTGIRYSLISAVQFPTTKHYGAAYIHSPLGGVIEVAGTGSDATLTHMDPFRLDRAQRFIRLQRWLDIPGPKLDWIMTSFGSLRRNADDALLNRDCLRVLGLYRRLRGRYKLEAEAFVAFWRYLCPFAIGSDRPFIEQVLAPHAGAEPLELNGKNFGYEAFGGDDAEIVEKLCAGLGISRAEFQLLAPLVQQEHQHAAGRLSLGLSEVSALYRLVNIPRLFGLNVVNGLALLRLVGDGSDAFVRMLAGVPRFGSDCRFEDYNKDGVESDISEDHKTIRTYYNACSEVSIRGGEIIFRHTGGAVPTEIVSVDSPAGLHFQLNQKNPERRFDVAEFAEEYRDAKIFVNHHQGAEVHHVSFTVAERGSAYPDVFDLLCLVEARADWLGGLKFTPLEVERLIGHGKPPLTATDAIVSLMETIRATLSSCLMQRDAFVQAGLPMKTPDEVDLDWLAELSVLVDANGLVLPLTDDSNVDALIAGRVEEIVRAMQAAGKLADDPETGEGVRAALRQLVQEFKARQESMLAGVLSPAYEVDVDVPAWLLVWSGSSTYQVLSFARTSVEAETLPRDVLELFYALGRHASVSRQLSLSGAVLGSLIRNPGWFGLNTPELSMKSLSALSDYWAWRASSSEEDRLLTYLAKANGLTAEGSPIVILAAPREGKVRAALKNEEGDWINAGDLHLAEALPAGSTVDVVVTDRDSGEVIERAVIAIPSDLGDLAHWLRYLAEMLNKHLRHVRAGRHDADPSAHRHRIPIWVSDRSREVHVHARTAPDEKLTALLAELTGLPVAEVVAASGHLGNGSLRTMPEIGWLLRLKKLSTQTGLSIAPLLRLGALTDTTSFEDYRTAGAAVMSAVVEAPNG